jgi:hypothetical protein
MGGEWNWLRIMSNGVFCYYNVSLVIKVTNSIDPNLSQIYQVTPISTVL